MVEESLNTEVKAAKAVVVVAVAVVEDPGKICNPKTKMETDLLKAWVDMETEANKAVVVATV